MSASSAPTMPRRDFLKNSAGLVAVSALGSAIPVSAAVHRRAIGANDRIRIGIIGCGSRGRTTHMPSIYAHLAATNFEIVALADPWSKAREQANGLVREWFGRDAKQFTSHRDLLEMQDVDAVMIASPDHLHITQLEDAAKGGKHVYVEKPLATKMDKLVRAVDAVKAAGIVVQVGTQLRSLPGIGGARELLRSGVLGKVSRIEENRNAPIPYWYKYLDRGARKEDLDWNEFLGDRPYRPFNADVYCAWHGYYDFSQGPVPQWGSHFLDMMHYVTDTAMPESCVCMGAITTWKDKYRFTAPDNVIGTWQYPGGLIVTSSNNFGNSAGNTRKFFCEKGTLSVDNWNSPHYSAEGGLKRDGSIRGKNDVTPVERPDHFLNWLQCMRTGETPNASIDAGYQHAVAVTMAVLSYETGRKTIYDPRQRKILMA